MTNETVSRVEESTITTTTGHTQVLANDQTRIATLSGAAAFGGNGAVGAAGAYNQIGGQVAALVEGGRIDATLVTIDAQREGDLEVWAVSGSGAGTAGFAGSIAVNEVGGTNSSTVTGGAVIAATGNALVLAETHDTVRSRAGAVGLGGSLGGAGAIAINDLRSTTTSRVSGTGTSLTGLGLSATEASVDNGSLAASGTSLQARRQQDTMRGAAVVSTSTAELENVAVSAAGGGSTAVAATVSVATVGGRTEAIVSEGAALQTALGHATQQARVGAFHHDQIVSGTGGGAVGGDAGVGGAVDTVLINRTTSAQVEDASAQAQQALRVQARSTTDITQAAVAVGGGVYAGLAGTGALVLMEGTTEALVRDAELDSQGSLTVEATSQSEVDLVAGALAVSGVAGVGVTAAVTVSNQQTRAVVDGASELNADGPTQVVAAATFEQTNHAYTAAAAGGVGVAGTVSVVVLKGSTDAEIGGTASINQDPTFGSASQDVTLSATDRATVNNRVGSLGVGLGSTGVGAVADVVLVNRGASATVGGQTRIAADRDIRVSAQATRSIDSLTTAAAGGATAGIAGAVSVIAVGARPEGDASANTSGSVNEAAGMVSRTATGDQLAADQSAGNGAAQRVNTARSGVAIDDDFNASVADTSAAAVVAAGATLEAGRDVTVTAQTQTDTDAIAVGAAVSGGVSLGGGVAIAQVEDRTVARLNGTTTAGGDVTVQAQDIQPDASVLQTYAGGAGLGGLAASFAWQDRSSVAEATLGGSLDAGGTVTVDAAVDHDLQALGGAAAVGVVGVGAAIARVQQDSEAHASVADSTQINAASLAVTGRSQTDSEAEVVAAAGGIVSGVGADADVHDASRATAGLGENARVRTTGGVLVQADVDPVARAEALGVAVSAGVSVGASLADVTVDTRAASSTGSGVDIEASRVDIAARTHLRTGESSAQADATAAAGGLLLGASATSAHAVVTSQTTTTLGDDNRITTTGDTVIETVSNTRGAADATGINVGLLAAGSNTASARTDTRTLTDIGAGADLTSDTLRVRAEGRDTLRANTLAGAGGLGAVVASQATTDADAQTHVRLGAATGAGGIVNARAVDIDATQHTNIDATADSTSAAAVGYSGARATNRVDTDTQIWIGQQTEVNSGEVVVLATNHVVKPQRSGFNVDSGSGGVLNAAAARSDTLIRNQALVHVEDGADIDVRQTGAAQGRLALSAANHVLAHDRTRLDSGGAIAIARAESEIRSDRNDAAVNIGQASLRSDGNIELSARTSAELFARANSKTYGLAGAAEGRSRAEVAARNDIRVGAGAFLEAEEDVHLMAGTDRTQGNTLNADAETRLWNRTAVPIETDPHAHGQIVQFNQIDVASGSEVRAVRDVYLTATEGQHRARGFGEGTDLYREALSEIGEFFGADTSSLKITGGTTFDNANVPPAFQFGQPPSSRVNVNGDIQAGIWHQQWLTIAPNGQITSSEAMEGKATLRDNVDLRVVLAAQIDALRAEAERRRQAANSYAGSDATDAALALDLDADILEAQLARLSGVDPIVGFVDIADTLARSGNVRVTGKALTGGGSGRLEAPGDVRIEIENQSTRFMLTGDLTIPDEGGGQITFNGLRVSSNADINARNASGQVSSLGQVIDAQSTPRPLIRVENTNSAALTPSNPESEPAQLWMQGAVNNLGGEVRATSHGTLRVSGDINAETVNLATGGDFIKLYTPGFTHQGGDPVAQLGALPGQREGLKVDHAQSLSPRTCADGDTSCSSTIAGNNVYISGERLNINGLIQAGLPERAIVIDATVADATVIANARAAWLASPVSANRYVNLTNPAPGSTAIQVRYDAEHDRLELADVRMGGGFMQLFGDIFSTGNGDLRVMDGYGRINVVNQTGYDLAVGRLDTGPGVEGMIRIIDTARRGVGNAPLVTEITRLGDTVTTRSSLTVDAQGAPTHVVSNTSGRSTTFNPLADRRFNWINGQTTQTDQERIYTTRVLFGADWLIPDYNDPDRTIPFAPVFTPRLTGDWLSSGSGNSADYSLDYSVFSTGWYRWRDDTEIRDGIACTDLGCLQEDITRTAYYRNITQEYFHHSLNASKPVAVTFTGFDNSSVSVDAGTGQLLFGGLVRSLTGDTTLTADGGMGSLNSDARIIGSQIGMTSAAGAIGTAQSPVRIELVDAGALTASGRNGVSVIASRGDLRVGSVVASHGNVSLAADGHIVGPAGVASVTGHDVSLVSLSGGIGTAGAPLVVETQGDASVLSARAASDVFLTEASGDMRLGQIESVAGDVVLTSPGRVLDANTVEQIDEQTRDELLALWSEMGLTGADAEASRQRNLSSQVTLLQQQYENYFRLRNLKRLDDGGFQADAYDPGFAFRATTVQAQALRAANGWGDTELAEFEAQQTAAYHAAFARFGGGGYVDTFVPTLTAEETAALSEGAVWTDAQLANSLAAGLFRPVSDTDIRIEQANVVGHDVSIRAQTGIGLQQASPVVIALGSDLSTLTEAQKLALLTAERSDIDVVGQEIRVRQFEDVDVTVSGRLDAQATSGSVLIGSESNLVLGEVRATDEARIKTSQSLTGEASLTHVVARHAVLEAGQGALGSPTTPLTVDLDQDGTLTARAGTDLFVQELDGPMRVNTVFARGDATLSVLNGSLLEARTDRALDVRATSVTLSASDTIGLPGADEALDVQVRNPGVLSASAPNGVYLSTTGLSGTLGDITTQGQFSLSVADGGITLGGTIQAQAGVNLSAADDVAFNGGSIVSDGDIEVRAGADGTGSIERTGGAGPDIQSGGDVTLAAPDAIGTTDPLRVVAAGPLNLQGRLMNVQFRPTVTGSATEVSISGIGGTTAQTVNLQVNGTSDLLLSTFVVGNARVLTDAPVLRLPAGFVGDAATFGTPFFTTRMDRQDRAPAPSGTTIRAFTLDGDFFLNLTPTVANVGDYVINYDLRRLVFGSPAGSAELTIGNSLRSTSGPLGLPSLTGPGTAEPDSGERELVEISMDTLNPTP